jgi:hypothetical protein
MDDASPPRYDPAAAPLRTDEQILTLTGQMIGPEARQWRSLVLFFLDHDDRTLPVVVPIDDLPEDPEPAVVENLCWILSQVLGEHAPRGSVVMMLTRPGPAEPDGTDLTWRDRLRDAAAGQGVRVRLICLATPAGVRAFTEDPLDASAGKKAAHRHPASG